MLVSGDKQPVPDWHHFSSNWLNVPDLVPESTGIQSIAVSTMESHTVKLLKFSICVLASYFCAQKLHINETVNTNMHISVL
jgi:hypothetical protein